MTTFPGSPKLLKGGLVLIDPDTWAVRRIIALQYNPDTLSRTLQIQSVGSEGGDRSEALRLKGPPVETIKLDAEIDATDQLEFPDRTRRASQLGIHPQLAALETIVYPTSSQLQANNSLAQAGTLEIAPMEAPLTLFVWSKQPHPAGAPDRLQHHRRSVRPGAQPDPRQGQPRHARAERRRPRLRPQGRQPVHELPAAERAARRQEPGGDVERARHRGIP